METHKQHERDREHPGQSGVTVSIDGVEKTIHRGSHTTSELKRLLGVDPGLAIDQVIEGALTPLTDDSRVTIKGGEVFFSHARTGGAA